jgi:exopolysaccharide production protein ExoQ
MPPRIATLICILLILYLFWIDREKNEGVSFSIWIPFFWIVIAGSRFVSNWLTPGSPELSVDAYLEGNPLDRAIFLILILSGITVLVRRRLNWGVWLRENTWIWLYFLFGAISILWSDYPFVAFKRLFKALGNVIMVLIILTEERPYASLGVILRRFSFLLLPLSVLFIKYYPDLGRGYHMGQPMLTGVAGQKNGLGTICLISGIYFSWSWLLSQSTAHASEKRRHYSVYLIILPMISWLTYISNSATSLACLIVALCIFAVGRQPVMVMRPQRILYLSITCLSLFGIMEIAFDIKNSVIAMLGRQPDLTTRVPMWQDLLTMVKNPLLGFGFESFWMGDRQKIVFERWGLTGNTHNGYLQMYLDLGYIGIFFVVAWILSGLRNVARKLIIDYPVAILRFCFIVVVCFYNYTEATLIGVSNIWIIFLLGIMDTPGSHRSPYEFENVEEGSW